MAYACMSHVTHINTLPVVFRVLLHGPARIHGVHMECVEVCCSVLQCVAVRCGVLRCVVVCCVHMDKFCHTYE